MTNQDKLEFIESLLKTYEPIGDELRVGIMYCKDLAKERVHNTRVNIHTALQVFTKFLSDRRIKSADRNVVRLKHRAGSAADIHISKTSFPKDFELQMASAIRAGSMSSTPTRIVWLDEFGKFPTKEPEMKIIGLPKASRKPFGESVNYVKSLNLGCTVKKVVFFKKGGKLNTIVELTDGRTSHQKKAKGTYGDGFFYGVLRANSKLI